MPGAASGMGGGVGLEVIAGTEHVHSHIRIAPSTRVDANAAGMRTYNKTQIIVFSAYLGWGWNGRSVWVLGVEGGQPDHIT